jgi:hypothetical protein
MLAFIQCITKISESSCYNHLSGLTKSNKNEHTIRVITTKYTPFNIHKKSKPQRLSLEAQPPDHRGEPSKDSSPHPRAYISAETLVEFYSFTFITI